MHSEYSLLWFCMNFAEGSVAFLELLYAFSLLEFLKNETLPLPIYSSPEQCRLPQRTGPLTQLVAAPVSLIPGLTCLPSIVCIAGDCDEHHSLSGHVVLSGAFFFFFFKTWAL